MCCFSRPVQNVSKTKIFARISGAYQILVYEMEYEAAEDLAMILPIPVVPNSAENAVKIINLEKHDSFFAKLDSLFPAEYRSEYGAKGLDMGLLRSFAPPLEVVSVGSFEASFVPTVDDFDRLDKRFVIPKEVWETIPEYKDFGFAVFKLKKGKFRQHPMAFKFPTRDVGQIFYPTAHIHDGEYHATETFDHSLYYQTDSPFRLHGGRWEEAAPFAPLDASEGVLLHKAKIFRKRVNGNLANKDLVYRFLKQ